MYKLPLPRDENNKHWKPKKVFERCIEGVLDKEKKRHLSALAKDVKKHSATYDLKARAAKLDTMPPKRAWKNVTKKDLEDVYEVGMNIRKGGAGIRKRLLMPVLICPLCGINKEAQTLDHHLPKSEFPILCVTPNNLVPACNSCQTLKANTYPLAPERQTLHPYFDDVENVKWLLVKVEDKGAGGSMSQLGFLYEVDPKASLDQITLERLKHHLKIFNLAARFEWQTMVNICSYEKRLLSLYNIGGKDKIKDFFLTAAQMSTDSHLNSYVIAGYEAAAQNDLFCNGGFMLMTKEYLAQRNLEQSERKPEEKKARRAYLKNTIVTKGKPTQRRNSP